VKQKTLQNWTGKPHEKTLLGRQMQVVNNINNNKGQMRLLYRNK